MTRLAYWEGEPVSVWRDHWAVPGFEAHDELPSTNDRLRAWAEKGADGFSVVVAESQSAGRGRSGSSWYSPPGNGLWMSILLPPLPPRATHLPLLVGVAAARAIDEVAGDVQTGIEWPNDLIVDGRKVGGILCEGVGRWVVAGVGINVRNPAGGFPPEIAERAGAVEELAGRGVSRGALGTRLITELRSLAPKGGASLHDAVLAELSDRDTLLGVAVVTDQEGEGVARGIASDGSLVLERRDGSRVPIVAGGVRPLG
jgi:BirA family transcriptional regulator, biotin operon repressor / biotin---[acetyl-CoA-carboxylase] ligase